MLIRIYDFAQFITISHGGVIEIYYNITWGGGSSRFITILQGGGGVSRDPKFVLRNIWTAPYDNHNGLTPNPSGAPPRRRLPSQGHCLFPFIALIADICVDHIVNYFKKKPCTFGHMGIYYIISHHVGHYYFSQY